MVYKIIIIKIKQTKINWVHIFGNTSIFDREEQYYRLVDRNWFFVHYEDVGFKNSFHHIPKEDIDIMPMWTEEVGTFI